MDNHDPRKPPLGRLIEAKVVPLPDGEYGLEGISEIFEDGDLPESLIGDGRKIVTRVREIRTISVEYDKSHLNEDGQILLKTLQDINHAEVTEYNKKALEPVSLLIITAGTFVLGTIATGFLNKIGEELYLQLKNALIEYFNKKKQREQVLQFCFGVVYNDLDLEVNLLLTNPSEAAITEIFQKGFMDLDVLLKDIDLETSPVGRIVYNYEDGRISLNYEVRPDGVPY